MKLGKDNRYHSSFRWEGRVYPVAGKTEAEVQRKIGRMQADLEAGKAARQKKITVRQYANEWVKTYGKEDYQSILDNHIIPDLGSLYLRDVSESTLQKFLNRKAEKYSKSYVTKMKLALCQMFYKARKNKLIADDPAEDLTVPECKEGRRRSLTDQERALLLAAIENHRGKLFVLCMLYCGLRPQEAAVLQWKHVDLKNKMIYIRQARKRKTGRVGPPKSDAGIRDIPIPQQLEAVLSAKQGAPDDYVCAWDNKPITQKKEAVMWANIKRQMDILGGAKLVWSERHKKSKPISAAIISKSILADDLDLYCIRHTYCTDLQKAGVPINIARELMGHSSIEVTAQIYTHTGTEEAKAAAEKLDSLPKPGIVYVKFGA